MVDGDVSLRKAIDKLRAFTVRLSVLAAKIGTRAISNRVSPLSLLSFPRQILGIILTRGPRWGVETDVGSPLLVLKASGSSSLATSTFISLRTVTNLEYVFLIF